MTDSQSFIALSVPPWSAWSLSSVCLTCTISLNLPLAPTIFCHLHFPLSFKTSFFLIFTLPCVVFLFSLTPVFFCFLQHSESLGGWVEGLAHFSLLQFRPFSFTSASLVPADILGLLSLSHHCAWLGRGGETVLSIMGWPADWWSTNQGAPSFYLWQPKWLFVSPSLGLYCPQPQAGLQNLVVYLFVCFARMNQVPFYCGGRFQRL